MKVLHAGCQQPPAPQVRSSGAWHPVCMSCADTLRFTRDATRRCSMRMITAVGVIALLAGCATAPPPAPSAGMQRFTGDVWTWDTQESTVTMMQDGGRAVRVKVSPDQLRTLRHHQWTTVTGTL